MKENVLLANPIVVHAKMLTHVLNAILQMFFIKMLANQIAQLVTMPVMEVAKLATIAVYVVLI